MDTKILLTGIISFIAGALLVSVAATTFEKPTNTDSLSSMVDSLKNKSGDEFDKEFINQMIVHHEGAVEMAKLAENQAKHEEIKNLSKNIITAQEKEISEMKLWQTQWGYGTGATDHNPH